jgi:hypothetical protein
MEGRRRAFREARGRGLEDWRRIELNQPQDGNTLMHNEQHIEIRDMLWVLVSWVFVMARYDRRMGNGVQDCR